MKFKYTTVVTLIAVMPFAKAIAKGDSTPKLRTDGYYLYDNGSTDSFQIVEGSKEDWLAITQQMEKEIGEPLVRKHTCYPDSTIFLGGPMLNYLAFFSDTTGTSIVTQCRDSIAFKNAMELINERRVGKDTSAWAKLSEIYNVTYFNDTFMQFYVSRHEFFKQKFDVHIYEDKLIVYMVREIDPVSMYDGDLKRVYNFIPFKEDYH